MGNLGIVVFQVPPTAHRFLRHWHFSKQPIYQRGIPSMTVPCVLLRFRDGLPPTHCSSFLSTSTHPWTSVLIALPKSTALHSLTPSPPLPISSVFHCCCYYMRRKKFRHRLSHTP